MPDYKADLQTNNTNLQTVLATVQNLSSESGSSTETWTLTMDDGSTKQEQVGIAKVCQVTYGLDNGITSSNTATFIRRGDTYETVLCSGDSSGYSEFDIVVVDVYNSSNETDWYFFSPDKSSPWLVYITIPNVDGDLYIDATLSDIYTSEDIV